MNRYRVLCAAWGLVAVCTTVPVVRAQERQDAAPADSLRAEYRATLLELRDSVAVLRADLDRFGRDLQMAGNLTVLSRAGRLNDRCVNLGVTLGDAEPVFRKGGDSPRLRDAARTLVRRMRDLRRTLRLQCAEGLAPTGPGVWADSLKAWGPHRTSQLARVLAAYDGAAAAVARAGEFKLQPETQ
jgi:hypothetical protein